MIQTRNQNLEKKNTQTSKDQRDIRWRTNMNNMSIIIHPKKTHIENTEIPSRK